MSVLDKDPIKLNKNRFKGLCLPVSTNSSILDLKILSRRVKLLLSQAVTEKALENLNEVYADINLTIQRTRALEAKHVEMSSEDTNKGRKLHQKRLIELANKNRYPYTVTIARPHMKYIYGIDKTLSVAVGDRYKKLIDQDTTTYIVESIGYFSRFLCHMVTLQSRKVFDGETIVSYITVPIHEIYENFFIHDIYYNTDHYYPYYCANCGTWHEYWENDGEDSVYTGA